MNRKSFWCRDAHTAAFSVEPPAKTIELTIHGKLTLTFGIDIDMEHLFFDVCILRRVGAECQTKIIPTHTCGMWV